MHVHEVYEYTDYPILVLLSLLTDYSVCLSDCVYVCKIVFGHLQISTTIFSREHGNLSFSTRLTHFICHAIYLYSDHSLAVFSFAYLLNLVS
jgi:hypothetical protein